MSAGAPTSRSILEGCLLRLGDIVGDGAAAAIIRYNAFEEGQLIARYASGDFRTALKLSDDALGMRSTLEVETEHRVHVRVAGGRSDRAMGPVWQTFMAGLLEGMILATRRRRFRGHVLASEGETTVLVHLEEGA